MYILKISINLCLFEYKKYLIIMIIEVKMCTDICDPYDLWPHISLYYDVTFLEKTMYIFIISIT